MPFLAPTCRKTLGFTFTTSIVTHEWEGVTCPLAQAFQATTIRNTPGFAFSASTSPEEEGALVPFPNVSGRQWRYPVSSCLCGRVVTSPTWSATGPGLIGLVTCLYYVIGLISCTDTDGLPVSYINCDRQQFVKFRGALQTVSGHHAGEQTGQTGCPQHWFSRSWLHCYV